jgi:two-component system chemotaxis response regulator CheY
MWGLANVIPQARDCALALQLVRWRTYGASSSLAVTGSEVTDVKSYGPESLRILIVDDSETMPRVVRTILCSRHWTICGEAENGRTGVEKFQKLKPNVVVLDLSMPDMTGIETAQQMSAADPSVPLILFTILWEIEGIRPAAQEAGIHAIVSKGEAWTLVGNIERIANEA